MSRRTAQRFVETLAVQGVHRIVIGPPSFKRRGGVGGSDVAEDVLFGGLLRVVPVPTASGGVGEGRDGTLTRGGTLLNNPCWRRFFWDPFSSV